MDVRTPEALLSALGGGALPNRPVLLAAHPDDEVVGASFLLGDGFHVVHLTDGAPEEPHLRSPDAPPSREGYAALRRTETLAALKDAGISEPFVHCLGAIDQRAVLQVERWVSAIVDRLVAWDADLLITHAYEGGHPDHDAEALVAHLARWRLARIGRPLVLAEMTAYFREDGALATGRFLPELATEPLRLIPTASLRARKRGQLSRHESQRAVLAAFDPDAPESYRLAPRYDFSSAPHEGTLHYELLGWLEGARWREHAGSTLRTLGVEEGEWL